MDQKQEVERYKYIHYVCSSCNEKRYMTLNRFMHLNRKDLKNKGLALYIDVHQDKKNPDQEHGMKIHVDEHFQVRSNDLLQFKTDSANMGNRKPIPGIPAPSLKISEFRFIQPSISWNYFQLDAHPHNISLRLYNDRKEIKEEIKVDLISPLASVRTNMRYNTELLSQEYLDRTKMWVDIVLKWVELSSEIDINVIIPLLRFVDSNHSVEPVLNDELAISILVDDSSLIKLTDEFINMEAIFRPRMNDYSGLYPMMGLNEDALKYITKIFNLKKFVYIKDFINNLTQAGGDNVNEYVDTFIQIFFDMMARDAFDFRVSYFT